MAVVKAMIRGTTVFKVLNLVPLFQRPLGDNLLCPELWDCGRSIIIRIWSWTPLAFTKVSSGPPPIPDYLRHARKKQIWKRNENENGGLTPGLSRAFGFSAEEDH